MNLLRKVAPAILSVIFCASAIASTIDITTLGAKPDGVTLGTAAIQKAIDTCHSAGGGTVEIPAGRFLTGALILKSNVTLHLSSGATLLASTDIKNYQTDGRLHLIYAANAENISIEGTGTIDGQGDAYVSTSKEKRPRPSPLIKFDATRLINIDGITIRNAPGWTLHPRDCDDVKIRGISILNNLGTINSDGIDIDSTRNVMISDCRIECGDDAIVLKTTRAGRDKTAPPVENVVVTNCILKSATCALKLGTESHGDFRHILFSNCVILDSRSGLSLFAKDGGAMEDVRFSNISITTKARTLNCHEWPIVIDIEKRAESSRISAIRDVVFSDLTIHTRGRNIVSGMPGATLEGVHFKNVIMRMTGYDTAATSKKVRGAVNLIKPAADYSKTPALFILAHARDITFSGITVRWSEEKAPQPLDIIFGDRVENVSVDGVRFRPDAALGKTTHFENSKNTPQ